MAQTLMFQSLYLCNPMSYMQILYKRKGRKLHRERILHNCIFNNITVGYGLIFLYPQPSFQWVLQWRVILVFISKQLQAYTVQCTVQLYWLAAQTKQTAYLLSQDGLRRPIVDPARHATFYDRFLECHLTAISCI